MAAPKVLLVVDVIVDPKMQMRAGGLNLEHAEDIARAIKKKQPIPPIEVYDVPDIGMIVTSGHHRLRAHQIAGRKEILATVKKGTYEEAQIAAAAANREHLGLKRTGGDKRRAIWELLKVLTEIKQRWSITRIAEHVGVSEELVSDIRKEYLEKLEAEDPNNPEITAKTVGKDGIARGPKKSNKKEVPDNPPDEAGVDTKDWRRMPLKEFLEAPDAVWAKIDDAGITAAGELYDHLKASGSMGLDKKVAQPVLDQLAELKKSKPNPNKKPTGGQEAFHWGQFDEPYGKMVRLTDEVTRIHDGEKKSPEYEGLMRLYDEVEKTIKAWKKRLSAKK